MDILLYKLRLLKFLGRSLIEELSYSRLDGFPGSATGEGRIYRFPYPARPVASLYVLYGQITGTADLFAKAELSVNTEKETGRDMCGGP